ncbi:MAG: Calx-beta domain-containing protein, partial [Ornithinibacter sp.]
MADLTGLRYDVYLDENGTGSQGQPFVNLKIDADANGSIDTTLSYVHTPIPLSTWTEVDTQDGSAVGSTGWFCQSSSVVTCGVAGLTWDQVLTLLPDEAVFQNSLGFPGSLIFNAGHSGSAAGETVRGAVDRFTWSLGDAIVVNDFEPAQISAADNTSPEPGAGALVAQIDVTLSGPNGFRSLDAPLAGRRGQPVTETYATADGTATAGEDYTPAEGTITFDPADPVTTRSVGIPVLADGVVDDG